MAMLHKGERKKKQRLVNHVVDRCGAAWLVAGFAEW
jgi:hypothetical protein